MLHSLNVVPLPPHLPTFILSLNNKKLGLKNIKNNKYTYNMTKYDKIWGTWGGDFYTTDSMVEFVESSSSSLSFPDIQSIDFTPI